MTSKQYGKMTGFELWHQRLSHSSNPKIRDTVHFAGLEDLRSLKCETNVKCPPGMIRTYTLEKYLLSLKTAAKEPLAQENIAIFSSSDQSIEWYNFAVVLLIVTQDTDDCTV